MRLGRVAPEISDRVHLAVTVELIAAEVEQHDGLRVDRPDRGREEAARTLGAGALDRWCTITLPLMAPGILAGALTAFVASLGEFGAIITFAGNIPGVTRTLPIALYSALQTPNGDAMAARLALMSFALGLAGLLMAELLARSLRRRLGR